jgi:hypothetical protein
MAETPGGSWMFSLKKLLARKPKPWTITQRRQKITEYRYYVLCHLIEVLLAGKIDLDTFNTLSSVSRRDWKKLAREHADEFYAKIGEPQAKSMTYLENWIKEEDHS